MNSSMLDDWRVLNNIDASGTLPLVRQLNFLYFNGFQVANRE